MTSRKDPRRIFRLPRWGRVLPDVDEELQFHLEMRYDDLVREGWSEGDARQEAERQFGDVVRVREECRRIGRRREGERGKRETKGKMMERPSGSRSRFQVIPRRWQVLKRSL